MHSISSKNFKHFFSLNPTTRFPSLFSPSRIICIILRKVGDIWWGFPYFHMFPYNDDKSSEPCDCSSKHFTGVLPREDQYGIPKPALVQPGDASKLFHSSKISPSKVAFMLSVVFTWLLFPRPHPISLCF